jgi:hypothetical protein
MPSSKMTIPTPLEAQSASTNLHTGRACTTLLGEAERYLICQREQGSRDALTPQTHTGGLANPRQGAPQKAAPKMLWQLKYKMV